MITEQYRVDVYSVVEKRKIDPLYKPSPSERVAIDAVLEADLRLKKRVEAVQVSKQCSLVGPENHDFSTMTTGAIT